VLTGDLVLVNPASACRSTVSFARAIPA